MRVCWFVYGFLVSVGMLGVPLRAHDPGLSTVQVTVTATEVHVLAAFAPTDAALLRPAELRVEPLTESTPGERAAQIATLYEIKHGERPLRLATAKMAILAGDNVQFQWAFARESTPTRDEPLALTSQAFVHLPPGHRTYLTIAGSDGGVMAETLLSARNPAYTWTPAAGSFDVPPESNATPASRLEPSALPPRSEDAHDPTSFPSFFKLGVEHILTGYDHLLFLLGLLAICRRGRALFAIITSFTLGHSVTLLSATLGVVALPSEIVEPLIAATLVYVGVENLLRRGAEPHGRWVLTFFFGLIHGFGFASVLRELGLGQDGTSLVTPLLAFNLGVEAGQLGVAGLAWPLMRWLQRSEPRAKRVVSILSSAVAGLGLYWLLARTVL